MLLLIHHLFQWYAAILAADMLFLCLVVLLSVGLFAVHLLGRANERGKPCN
jgi:hypothetical protein